MCTDTILQSWWSALTLFCKLGRYWGLKGKCIVGCELTRPTVYRGKIKGRKNKTMFDARSNEWGFMSIPAKSWKYTGGGYQSPYLSYASYPEGIVTHRENEPFIVCSNCLVPFSTNPRRKNERGEWTYAAVSNLITYQRATNNYICIVPCKAHTPINK